MPFNFLLLPGEIRNSILRLLLTHNTPIIARSANQLAPPKHVQLQLCPNILLASWRTYHEGISYLYGDNVFQAHPSYLTSVLFAMDPSRTVVAPACVQRIRRFHIRVRLDCDPYYKPEAVAKAFRGAEVLEVEVFRSSWAIGGYDALQGFMGIRGVQRAKVHGSIGIRFAKWLEKVMQSSEGVATEEWEGIDEFGWVAHRDTGGQDPWKWDR